MREHFLEGLPVDQTRQRSTHRQATKSRAASSPALNCRRPWLQTRSASFSTPHKRCHPFPDAPLWAGLRRPFGWKPKSGFPGHAARIRGSTSSSRPRKYSSASSLNASSHFATARRQTGQKPIGTIGASAWSHTLGSVMNCTPAGSPANALMPGNSSSTLSVSLPLHAACLDRSDLFWCTCITSRDNGRTAGQ